MRARMSVRSRFGAASCLALSILALLLWGKLKLVTGVPRTAYAEPKAELAPARPAARAAAMPPARAPIAEQPLPSDRQDLAGD